LADKKKRKLESTIAALQDRWGEKSIGRLGSKGMASVPHVATGFPDLDQILGNGGLPRGRISELIAKPTSGAATIALRVAANAQRESTSTTGEDPIGGAIYIDLDHSFDPEYAARCGLDLSQLVLVRPQDAKQGLAIMRDFIIGGGLSVLVFDAPLEQLAEGRTAQRLATTLDQIIAPLGQSFCLLLFLTTPPAGGGMDAASNQLTVAHYAAVRLLVQRQRWIYKGGDISGYQAQVTVLKNKAGPAGKKATVTILLDMENSIPRDVDRFASGKSLDPNLRGNPQE